MNKIKINKYHNQPPNPFSVMNNKKLQQTALKIIHLFKKTDIHQTNNSQEISQTVQKMKLLQSKLAKEIKIIQRKNNRNSNDQSDNTFQQDIFKPYMYSEQTRQTKQSLLKRQNSASYKNYIQSQNLTKLNSYTILSATL